MLASGGRLECKKKEGKNEENKEWDADLEVGVGGKWLQVVVGGGKWGTKKRDGEL